MNDRVITDPIEIANNFNTFLSLIAKEIGDKIPNTTVEPESYLTEFTNDSFLLNPMNPEIIIETISSLETKTSLDIDGFNTKVLKVVSTNIAPPLEKL